MPFLSALAKKKKIKYFLRAVPRDASVLEVGSGDGWVKNHFKKQKRINYTGIDLKPPADIVGDIKNWRALGLRPESFDFIIAFEVVEHVDCFQECCDLLKPGGKLMLTSPVPSMDWLLKILESLGLNQRRTSPHDHLVDFKQIPHFKAKKIKIVGGLSQWGIFTK